MPLDNSINHLHPLLKAVYEEAKAAYIQAHPATPDNPTPAYPRLNETARSEAVQNAYYQQGRGMAVADLNALRKAAGLWSISAAEASLKVTNARYGQSAHNFPAARAFDVAFVNSRGGYIQSNELYDAFWKYLKVAGQKLGVGLTWGGTWGDYPHTELTNWRKMRS